MLRHQILIANDAIGSFERQRQFVKEQKDGVLKWYLLRMGSGWALISGPFLFVDIIPRTKVSAQLVEEFLLFTVELRSLETDLSEEPSVDDISWAVAKRVPSNVARRLKATIKSL